MPFPFPLQSLKKEIDCSEDDNSSHSRHMQQRSASAGGGLGGDLDYRASHESVSLRFGDNFDPGPSPDPAPEFPPLKIRFETNPCQNSKRNSSPRRCLSVNAFAASIG